MLLSLFIGCTDLSVLAFEVELAKMNFFTIEVWLQYINICAFLSLRWVARSSCALFGL